MTGQALERQEVELVQQDPVPICCNLADLLQSSLPQYSLVNYNGCQHARVHQNFECELNKQKILCSETKSLDNCQLPTGCYLLCIVHNCAQCLGKKKTGYVKKKKIYILIKTVTKYHHIRGCSFFCFHKQNNKHVCQVPASSISNWQFFTPQFISCTLVVKKIITRAVRKIKLELLYNMFATHGDSYVDLCGGFVLFQKLINFFLLPLMHLFIAF